MARGKYAASAAKRRAESAEEQLDRLLPKLVDTERLLKRYKSEAEAAPILRRRIAELEQQVGVPMSVHLQALKDLEEQFAAERSKEEDGWIEVLFKFEEVMSKSMSAQTYLRDSNWINARFLKAIRQIPKPLAVRALAVLGQDREARRGMLESNMSSRTQAENMHDALLFEAIAKAEGNEGITESMVEPSRFSLSDKDPIDDFDAEAAALSD